MSRGLTIFECRACGKAVFPRRLLCPGCGASEWVRRAVDRGTLAEATTLRRFSGREAEVRLGSVEIAPHLVVIARLVAKVSPGAPVAIRADGEVPVAEELA